MSSRQEELIVEVFAILDQKSRGFISRMELAYILEAMQADPTVHFVVPHELKPPSMGGSIKDSRVVIADLIKYLGDLSVATLEDVKWFTESVVRVERELKEVWRQAVHRWRVSAAALHKRDLHRYLLTSQPERVSRWLLLRTSVVQPSSDRFAEEDAGNEGLLHLGMSVHEVEVLFADDTAEDVNQCADKLLPFHQALEVRDLLVRTCDALTPGCPCPPDEDVLVCELLRRLSEYADQKRELATLLIHEDCLSFVTALVSCGVFSQSVVSEGSKLILTLLRWRMHENAHDHERSCGQQVATYLEMHFDPQSLLPAIAADGGQLFTIGGPGQSMLRRPLHISILAAEMRHTVGDWVESLVNLSSDFDRGEMLDLLIRSDERRLFLESEGGDRADDNAPILVSLFSYGRVVPYLLRRLDISSHHSLHEHRTPIRANLWKFLLNILSSAGERGRRLFRVAEGIRIVCSVARGSSWGSEREEVTQDEELDIEEQEELYESSLSAWGIQDAQTSWPLVELLTMSRGYNEKGPPCSDARFYRMDFVDDKFYGSKDRDLACAFLEYMSSADMWGEVALAEEMMQYANTLQVLCRLSPPPCFLLRLLVSSDAFSSYVAGVAETVADAYVQKMLSSISEADAFRPSFFPVCLKAGKQAQTAEASNLFRSDLVAIEAQNVLLRILAYAYHSLQTYLKDGGAREGALVVPDEIDGGDPSQASGTPSLADEIHDCCKRIAHRLPLSKEDINDVCVAIYWQVLEFKRKSLLALNPLANTPAVNTAAARPTHFAQYQQSMMKRSTSSIGLKRMSDSAPPLQHSQTSVYSLLSTENSCWGEPCPFPCEFLVVLRLVQLIHLRERVVPQFLAELEDLLEQLTGTFWSTSPSEKPLGIDLAGVEYPWRTGFAQLTTFRIAEVPLRRSHLRRFPRRGPLEVIQGLDGILREFAALGMWDEGAALATQGIREDPQQESLRLRRDIYLALVFKHLCHFTPETVILEDLPQGLSLRLGITSEHLASVQVLLESFPSSSIGSGASFESKLPPGCSFHRSRKSGSVGGSIGLLLVAVLDTVLAFVCLQDVWTLWANSTRHIAQVLTDTGNRNEILQYFGLDESSPSLQDE